MFIKIVGICVFVIMLYVIVDYIKNITSSDDME